MANQFIEGWRKEEIRLIRLNKPKHNDVLFKNSETDFETKEIDQPIPKDILDYYDFRLIYRYVKFLSSLMNLPKTTMEIHNKYITKPIS